MKEHWIHITREQFEAYFANTASEYERELIELEIQLCEQCMTTFMTLLEKQTWEPKIEIEEACKQIIGQIQKQAIVKKPKLIQRPIVQYVIAASITLLLVTSGFMSSVSHKLGSLEQVKQTEQIEIQDPEPASSTEKLKHEQWIDMATQWIDHLQDIRFK